jgi:hypothetical protein
LLDSARVVDHCEANGVSRSIMSNLSELGYTKELEWMTQHSHRLRCICSEFREMKCVKQPKDLTPRSTRTLHVLYL